MSTHQGIVAHITTEDVSGFQTALRNLRNLAQDDSVSTPAAQIQVVINGPAVRFLRASSPDAGKISGMVSAGVTVNACENSLARFGHEPDEMAEGVSLVQSGVAAVVRAQQGGKHYLKLP